MMQSIYIHVNSPIHAFRHTEVPRLPHAPRYVAESVGAHAHGGTPGAPHLWRVPLPSPARLTVL